MPSLLAARPAAFAQMHPLLADLLGIEDGEQVLLRTRSGELRVPAEVTEEIRPDTVFMPFHYPGEGSANLLTGSATDPLSGMPGFKVTALEVLPAPRPVPAPDVVTVQQRSAV